MKKLVIALMAFALVISLAGCGGGGGSSKDNYDYGQFLRDNKEYTPIYDNYQALTKALASCKKGKEAESAKAFLSYVDPNYNNGGKKFADIENRLAATSGTKGVLYRFDIQEFKFEPLSTVTATSTKVIEKTNYYIKATVRAGETGNELLKNGANKQDDLTWEKKNGNWVITGGLSILWNE